MQGWHGKNIVNVELWGNVQLLAKTCMRWISNFVSALSSRDCLLVDLLGLGIGELGPNLDLLGPACTIGHVTCDM